MGTVSKILATAIRLGFVIVPEDMIEKWKPAKKYTDVHTDALSQQTLAAFINKGRLERHIWKMRKLYKRKRACLLNSLSNHFGRNYEIKGQAAGLHLVAGFPGITFTQELTDILWSKYGLKVVPVERHSLVKDGSHKHEIVLGYSHLSEEEIEEGVRRLKLGLSDNQFWPDCA